MSTKLRTHATRGWQRERELCSEHAPRTFDPMNRNKCPAVIDDKWQGEHEAE